MSQSCGVRKGCIGVFGAKTRSMQKKLSAELFGLVYKSAEFFLYMGDANADIPDINDVGNSIFMEVPDRAYSPTPITVHIGLEPMQEGKADYSQYGYIDPVGNQIMFRVHVDDYECIGRPPIIGDVFEIPFFTRDDKRSLWEVTDVDRKTEYEKYYSVCYASPLGKSRSSNEIPVDRDNDDTLAALMAGMDDAQSDQVPDAIPDITEPAKTKVDYRNKKQRSFLDDPTKLL